MFSWRDGVLASEGLFPGAAAGNSGSFQIWPHRATVETCGDNVFFCLSVLVWCPFGDAWLMTQFTLTL